jgi:hypothetical protein
MEQIGPSNDQSTIKESVLKFMSGLLKIWTAESIASRAFKMRSRFSEYKERAITKYPYSASTR